MDRDVFGRCTQLGRQVGEAVVNALEGGPWSDFLATKMLEDLIQQAGGIPSARAIFGLVERSRLFPYLPGFAGDTVQREVDEILRQSGAGTLDMVLAETAKRLLPYRPTAADIARESLLTTLLQHCFESRGGLLETRGATWYESRRPEIRGVLGPVAERSASILVERPGARVLGLARSERLTPDDDLTGSVIRQ